MAHGKRAALDKLDDRIGKRKQALQVGDMAAALVHHARDLGLRQAFAFRQTIVGARLFDGIEVFALEVLDQRERHDVTLAQLTDQRRYFMQLRFLSGAPTTLTRHDLVAAIVERAHDDRLNDAALRN